MLMILKCCIDTYDSSSPDLAKLHEVFYYVTLHADNYPLYAFMIEVIASFLLQISHIKTHKIAVTGFKVECLSLKRCNTLLTEPAAHSNLIPKHVTCTVVLLVVSIEYTLEL